MKNLEKFMYKMREDEREPGTEGRFIRVLGLNHCNVGYSQYQQDLTTLSFSTFPGLN